jgi:altronate dehydratase
MVEIKANSLEEAEEVMQRFIDAIGEIMSDEVRWDEADWSIEEHILDEAKGEWVTSE